MPIRTVILIDGNGVSSETVRQAAKQLASEYNQDVNPHYIIATRNGRLTSDVIFEKEILDFVNNICEVKDNTIQLKGGYQEVDVIRKNA